MREVGFEPTQPTALELCPDEVLSPAPLTKLGHSRVKTMRTDIRFFG